MLFPRDSAPEFFDQLVGACRQAGFAPRVTHQATAMPTMIGLVAAALGIALVPNSMPRLALEGVTYRDLSQPGPRADVAIVTSRHNDRALRRSFIHSVRQSVH